MKQTKNALVAFTLVLSAFAAHIYAANPPQTPPASGRIMRDTRTMIAKGAVKAVDAGSNTIILALNSGGSLVLKVGKNSRIISGNKMQTDINVLKDAKAVKVIYKNMGGNNLALSIHVLPEPGAKSVKIGK